MEKILNYFNEVLISLDIISLPKNTTPYNSNTTTQQTASKSHK